MADYGMKISLPGYDVHTAEPHQCAVHSGYPCLKTKAKYQPANFYAPAGMYHYGTVTINFVNNPPAGVDTDIFLIQHDMPAGYTPACLVRGKYTTSLGGVSQGTLPIDPAATLSFYATTDQQFFKVRVRRDLGWGTMIGDSITFNYMIFCENGA